MYLQMRALWILPKIRFQWLALLALPRESCATPNESRGEFAVDRNDLALTGHNPYFMFEPGYRGSGMRDSV